MTLMKWVSCLIFGHLWWEHRNFEKIDRCIRCQIEKPHQSDGCTCTICRTPGGLDGFKLRQSQEGRK